MLAERMKSFSESATSVVSNKVAELRAAGKEIISLNVGEPDFNTPAYINAAAVAAMEQGFTKYTPTAGILELRKAIAKKLQQDNNVSYDVAEISVAAGAKQSIFNAVMALVGPGSGAYG